MLTLLAGASVGTATSLADVAPQQWQPTSADLSRTVRPCTQAVSAPAAPVCWSMSEDASAWMAQPAGSPYGWGQCTYYVGLMRPDIWNDRAPPSADPQNDWDAWTWAEHAQAEGLPVDGSPAAGDVMVWSRQAVGNDTGHVAIVDAVGGTDPSTGDLEITISEMNLDGVDDPSQGQGDTMIVEVPQSQLVPGMIQFIHRPGPGYTPPAWPNGAAPQANVGGASPGQWATESNPSLGVGLFNDHVATVSQSPAPAVATVTTNDGALAKRVTLTANRVAALNLPTGNYKVCVTQAASGGWAAASGCDTASWRAPVSAKVSVGRLHRAGRHLSVPVQLGPTLPVSLAAHGVPVVADVRLRVTPTGQAGRARAASAPMTYTRAMKLRAGHQTLTLSLARSALRHAVLRVTVVVRGTANIHASTAQSSIRA